MQQWCFAMVGFRVLVIHLFPCSALICRRRLSMDKRRQRAGQAPGRFTWKGVKSRRASPSVPTPDGGISRIRCQCRWCQCRVGPRRLHAQVRVHIALTNVALTHTALTHTALPHTAPTHAALMYIALTHILPSHMLLSPMLLSYIDLFNR